MIFRFFSLLLYLFLSVHPLLSEWSNDTIMYRKEIEIIGTDDINRIYIPPPDRSKGVKAVQFEINYFNFPPEARVAFEYAADIWSSLLSSDEKIRVSARWVNMEGSTLGSSQRPSLFPGESFQAPYANLLYPSALADRIARKPVNDDSRYDIELRFNFNVNWYYGLDGDTPADSYDLVTVALHELCHGLGFFDSFAVSGELGFRGLSGLPVVYDIFVEDIQGRKLTDTIIYPDESQALGDALTGGTLYFAGPMTMTYLGGSAPSLYVPGVFSAGSSISHLSESATPQKYALMTPFIAKGEAIHNPGELTMAIMGDLGWTNTWLFHDDLNGTEEELLDIPFEVVVISDTLLKSEGVRLHYRTGDNNEYSTAIMNDSGSDGIFQYSLNAPPYNSSIYYYFSVVDTFNREFYYPYGWEDSPNYFYLGTDTISPVIIHNPDRYVLSNIDTLVIVAKITDNIYSPVARLEYKVNSGGYTETIEMTNDSTSYYSARLSMNEMFFIHGDTILYRIIADDQADDPNFSFFPESGFQKLPVHIMFEPLENYFNPFSSGGNDFIMYDFSVEQPVGFNDPALHTVHPYEASVNPEDNISYETILRHPVIIDSSGLFLSFIEVVLVEPGLPGYSYLERDFYDYVIVEGSSNGGRSWFPLVNGYDSRASGEWLDAYYRLMSGNSSETPGDIDLFMPRVISIDTSDTRINEGDLITIRFRLSSNQTNNGWGWAIDNLFIKGIASYVRSSTATTMKVYPNPGDGRFTLHTGNEASRQRDRIEVIDQSGKIVWSSELSAAALYTIDIAHLPIGLYYLRIIQDGIPAILRYSKVR